MVVFSQMKSATTIALVLASTVSAMREEVVILDPAQQGPGEAAGEPEEESGPSLTPIQKMAIVTGVGVAAGCAGGSTYIMRSERNDNEALTDIASAQGIDMLVMTRDQANRHNIDIQEPPMEGEVPNVHVKPVSQLDLELPVPVQQGQGLDELDATIFYQNGNDTNNGIAHNIETQLEENGILDNIDVQGIDGDFGQYDLIVVQDIDPTSLGQTWGMICLIGFGALVLAGIILAVTKDNYGGNNQKALTYVVTFAAVCGASVSAGYGLHFLSADNLGAMGGCAAGFGLVVICLAFYLNSTRENKLEPWTLAKHLTGGAALLGGCVMLTNLAGEAVGENAVIKLFNTEAPSGMAEEAFVSGGLFFFGFLWVFFTLFDAEFTGRKFALVLGAVASSALVVGGVELIALETFALFPCLCFIGVPLVILSILLFKKSSITCRKGKGGEVDL